MPQVISFEGFESPGDTAAERAVGARLAAAWGCQIHFFGRFNPLDCYAEMGGRMAALVEVKSRSHKSTAYPTIFLSVRKHFCLTLASTLYCVPATFVAGFSDDKVGWCAIGEIDASKHIIGGHNDPRTRNDREPLIEVPISQLLWLP